jgi:hypothetical protein
VDEGDESGSVWRGQGVNWADSKLRITPDGSIIQEKEAPMIQLTEQQRQELATPEPLAIDPQTRQTYVLVRQESYARLKSLLALEDYDADEGAGYINEVMADDDANDPLLESYQKHGKPA